MLQISCYGFADSFQPFWISFLNSLITAFPDVLIWIFLYVDFLMILFFSEIHYYAGTKYSQPLQHQTDITEPKILPNTWERRHKPFFFLHYSKGPWSPGGKARDAWWQIYVMRNDSVLAIFFLELCFNVLISGLFDYYMNWC